MSYRALVVTESQPKTYTRAVTSREIADLPKNDTLIRVHYSGLNYKDALSATGNKGVTRNFPHTPGIDAAGLVVESTNPALKAGEAVICTSFDLGMNTPGGFGEYIRVPSDWVVPLPAGLSLKESMVLGTAGYTAAMCVQKLQHMAIAPAMGEVLVTGATGGVGSCAVAILAKLGYKVVAATGKLAEADWLKALGATSVVHRDELNDNSKPMFGTRWAGVVDTVGGTMLANAIKSCMPNGCVTACGMVQSPDLTVNVYPFILRGVSLCGVNSQADEMPNRKALWNLLAGAWKPASLEAISPSEVSLDGLSEKIDLILKGGVRGRVLVNLVQP